MKRITFRLIAVVLALSVVGSALFSSSALAGAYEKEIAYSFYGVSYVCFASAVRNERSERDEEEYEIAFSFDSVAEPFAASLNKGGFSLDNTQPGMEHVYRQELWNVFAEYCIDLYSAAFGRDMVGRSLEGATRELQMHYWIYQFSGRLLKMVKPIDLLVGKAQPFEKLFRLLRSVHNRAKVTELGPTDGSDFNGYIFEQADSDVQALLRFGIEILSLDFMSDLLDRTGQMSFNTLHRVDQILFHPNDLEKLEERQTVRKLTNEKAPFTR